MNDGICRQCEVSFKYSPSQKRGLYCSNSCQMLFQRNLKVINGRASARTVRQYMLDNVEYKCNSCELGSIWNGKPITLQMDHIDGDNKRNILSNLRWLCPNCHTQTHTWGVANVSKDGRERLSTRK